MLIEFRKLRFQPSAFINSGRSVITGRKTQNGQKQSLIPFLALFRLPLVKEEDNRSRIHDECQERN